MNQKPFVWWNWIFEVPLSRKVHRRVVTYYDSSVLLAVPACVSFQGQLGPMEHSDKHDVVLCTLLKPLCAAAVSLLSSLLLPKSPNPPVAQVQARPT